MRETGGKIEGVLEDITKDIQRQLKFIVEGKDNPEIIFSRSDSELRSVRDNIFKVLNVYEEGKRVIGPSDLMSYLAYLLNKFMRDWIKKNNIKYDLYVRLRNPNSFPSLFAIYYEEKELMQFNIFEKFYGIRDDECNEEKIIERFNKSKKHYEEQKSYYEDKLNEMERFRKYPLKYLWKSYRGYKKREYSLRNEVKDYLSIIFRRKQLLEESKKLVDKYSNLLEKVENEMPLDEELKENVEKCRKYDDIVKSMVVLFESYGYRLESEKHKLY